MDIFGNSMGFQQRQIVVGAYLYIHINTRAEFTGLQDVDMVNALLSFDKGGHGVDGGFVTGAVDHFIDGVFKDIISGIDDHHTDDDAGQWVQDWVTQAGAQDTDEAANRGESIAAVVPGIGQQGAGVYFDGGLFGVPEHTFFDDDGNTGGDEGQAARYFQVAGTGVHDLFQAAIADANACEG